MQETQIDQRIKEIEIKKLIGENAKKALEIINKKRK